MENFEEKKIVPIERGEETKIEKLKERVDGAYKETTALIDRILKIEMEKEKQLEKELKKPTTAQNIELLSLLHEDLDEINNVEGDLFAIIQETLEKQEEIREKLIEISERIEKKGF